MYTVVLFLIRPLDYFELLQISTKSVLYYKFHLINIIFVGSMMVWR